VCPDYGSLNWIIHSGIAFRCCQLFPLSERKIAAVHGGNVTGKSYQCPLNMTRRFHVVFIKLRLDCIRIIGIGLLFVLIQKMASEISGKYIA
jgi:hypothetical protein